LDALKLNLKLSLKGILILFSTAVLLSGCQIGYVFKSAKGQLQILNNREPISLAQNDERLNPDEKRKLILAKEAKDFAVTKLGLKSSKNYSRYTKLDRPYVSWVVSASAKNEVKSYNWWFPIVGSFPYKGFFSEADAQQEAQELKDKNLDTFLRGVSAYSTLGWFEDPVVSPMLAYSDHDLVNTIIHETTHATLFIKNSADFNERMATFVGNMGSQLFYLEKEGPESETVKKIKSEHADDLKFARFITSEIRELENWYKQNQTITEEARALRLKSINEKFKKEVSPGLATNSWKRFESLELNNARLVSYKTYYQDLSDFEKAYEKYGNIPAFIEFMKTLEKNQKPAQALKDSLGIPASSQ
jgi:predicted aminopeptidase